MGVRLLKPLPLLARDLFGGDGEAAGMTTRRGVSMVALRPGSVGGEPMTNSTGPSMMANVCP
jgi:hypothetical protein